MIFETNLKANLVTFWTMVLDSYKLILHLVCKTNNTNHGQFSTEYLFQFFKSQKAEARSGTEFDKHWNTQHFLNRILSFQTWKMGQPKSNMLPRLNCRNGHQPSKLNLNPILFYFRTGNTWLQFVDLHLFHQQLINF